MSSPNALLFMFLYIFILCYIYFFINIPTGHISVILLMGVIKTSVIVIRSISTNESQ